MGSLRYSAPGPAEGDEPLAFIVSTSPRGIRPFWNFQRMRAADYANLTDGVQRIWDDAAPPEIKSATGKMKSVAISALLGNYNIGGASWMSQFPYGCQSVGNLSHEGISPWGTSMRQAPPVEGIWTASRSRCVTLSRSSGFLHAETLWKDALDQVDRGWMAPPLPIDPDGAVATYAQGSVNKAFRFGVDQVAKLRACDGRKQVEANLYCAVRTPIKLPTWGHIAQMCLNVRPSRT